MNVTARYIFQSLVLLILGLNVIAQSTPAESPDNLLLRARISIDQNELERAESELRQYLGIILVQIGSAYSVSEDQDTAFRAYQEASQASIISDRPLLSLTRFCIRTGRFEEGKEAVQKLLAINPIHPGGRHLLGKLLILSGETEPASHALKDAYLAAPENLEIGFTLAYSYLKRKDLTNGVPLFEKLYSESGNSPALALKIGRAFLETGFPTQAEQYLKTASDAGVEGANNYIGQSVSVGTPDVSNLLTESESPAIPNGGFNIPALRRSAAFTYGKLGELEMRNRRFSWAEDHIGRAIWWDAGLAGLHVLQGWARYNNGKLLEAIDPIKTALTKQPGDLEARQLLIRITIELIDNKHLSQAKDCSEFLVSTDPNTALFYVLRGRMNAESGRVTPALSDFSKALQLDPQIPEAHYNSGILHLKNEDVTSALREFNAELEIDPEHDMALFRKAEALNRLERNQEAISNLYKSVELNPRLTQAYLLLAQIQISAGNLTSALANLETASRIEPENPEILLQLANLYDRAGRSDEASSTRSKYESLVSQP